MPSGRTKVPALVDDGEWIADSWTIAIHLERKYPERPSLFAGAQGLTKIYNSLADGLVASIFPFIALHPVSGSRQGRRLFPAEAGRNGLESLWRTWSQIVLPKFRVFARVLRPCGAVVANQPFFGGDKPLYADYALVWSVPMGPMREWPHLAG